MFTCLIIAINLLKPPPQNYDIFNHFVRHSKAKSFLKRKYFTAALKSEHLN